MQEFLRLSPRLKTLPVVHGSGDFCVRVREELLSGRYDCVAVPLPATWRHEVLDAIDILPGISAVVQVEADGEACSYVPIDPCQPVIAALRFARSERLAIEFIDLETSVFEVQQANWPDPYALKTVALEKYLAAALPIIPRPESGSQADLRARRMAFELHRLELEYQQILFLPGLLDWPWIRENYTERNVYPEHEQFFAPLHTYRVDRRTLPFFLGELPFVTALYERARSTLDPDENLAIDGIKELVLEARDRWAAKRAADQSSASDTADNWLNPKLLQIYFQYVRNLTLMGRRLTPDLFTLVIAAKQIAGDSFALSVLETAREYSVDEDEQTTELLRMAIDEADVPGPGVTRMKCRLPGPQLTWRTCELHPDPPRQRHALYQLLWDPYRQCSWPPEDQKIESFTTHVRDQAKALIGADLARSEKFTTSLKDGLDIRETLRHWHKGDLYVKVLPPARGNIEVVVFLFDVPADPQKYPWRATWQSEHNEESTICFFATDFSRRMVGPGVAQAVYGGVFFLWPPRYVPEVWSDPRLPRQGTLEEQLLAAALFHSNESVIAVVSPCPLKAVWRRLARQFGKRLIHLPLKRFSGRTIDRLRHFHVLNGREVRSYAASFIREG